MDNRQTQVLFLVFLSISLFIITVSGGKGFLTTAAGTNNRKNNNVKVFNRPCTSNDNCQFSIGTSTAYLVCNTKRKRCACKNDEGWADIAIWDISWKITTQECLFGATGPCGTDNGLTIGCKNGLECIEQKCRNPEKLRSNLENYSCDDDIDCSSGLKCEVVGFEYGEDKRCVKVDKDKNTASS